MSVSWIYLSCCILAIDSTGQREAKEEEEEDKTTLLYKLECFIGTFTKKTKWMKRGHENEHKMDLPKLMHSFQLIPMDSAKLNKKRKKRKKTKLNYINCSVLWGFPPLRKTVSPQVKNYDFSRVFEIANQLLARHSLYLAP